MSDFIRIHSPVLELKHADKGYLPYVHIIQRTCISKIGYKSSPKARVFQNIIVLIFKLHVKLQGGVQNVIPLIVHITHFIITKAFDIWYRINPHRLENCS